MNVDELAAAMKEMQERGLGQVPVVWFADDDDCEVSSVEYNEDSTPAVLLQA